jgi:hypothetical protein
MFRCFARSELPGTSPPGGAQMNTFRMSVIFVVLPAQDQERNHAPNHNRADGNE